MKKVVGMMLFLAVCTCGFAQSAMSLYVNGLKSFEQKDYTSAIENFSKAADMVMKDQRTV